MTIANIDSFYRLLDGCGEYALNPDWDTVKNTLLSLKNNPECQISFHSGGEDSWLIICYKEQYGFYVTGAGIDDVDYSVLYEASQTDEIIAFWDGQEWIGQPRFVFILESTMLQALETFYQTGHRDQTLSWWLEYELAERYDIQPIDPCDYDETDCLRI
jgi:hypothetical protein